MDGDERVQHSGQVRCALGRRGEAREVYGECTCGQYSVARLRRGMWI